MRSRSSTRNDQAYLVTDAQQARSAEISQRQRRYLLMMGVRVVCFVLTVVLFLEHAGWLTIIPAAGAIALPYFAVVIANSRQPVSSAGFRQYEPNLPQRYAGENGRSAQSGAAGSSSGQAGRVADGAPRQSAG